MARLVKLESNKTYATEANVVKAVEKCTAFKDLRYFIQRNEEGRFFPVFIGQPALAACVHFYFSVVA